MLGLAADVLAVDLRPRDARARPRWSGSSCSPGCSRPTLTCVVAYGAALVTYRLGWDPDNNGVPLVSSASDFLGAASFMVSLVILGLS